MNGRTEKWLYGLGSAFIGGGASAVTSGITAMGFAPDKFNLSDMHGTARLLSLIGVNFIVSGIFSAFFYLRQSPLPQPSTGNTDQFSNPNPPATAQPKEP